MSQPIEQFDDAAVLRILSEVTGELKEQLTRSEAAAVASLADARAVIAALLEQQNSGSVDYERLFSENQSDPKVARHLLTLLMTDADTKDVANGSVENPPTASQKSVELAIGGAVILGSLVAWLQTAIEIEILRKDGKSEFTFRMKKDATKGKTLTDIAKTIAKLIP
jgi:hypothetical protein